MQVLKDSLRSAAVKAVGSNGQGAGVAGDEVQWQGGCRLLDAAPRTTAPDWARPQRRGRPSRPRRRGRGRRHRPRSRRRVAAVRRQRPGRSSPRCLSRRTPSRAATASRVASRPCGAGAASTSRKCAPCTMSFVAPSLRVGQRRALSPALDGQMDGDDQDGGCRLAVSMTTVLGPPASAGESFDLS